MIKVFLKGALRAYEENTEGKWRLSLLPLHPLEKVPSDIEVTCWTSGNIFECNWNTRLQGLRLQRTYPCWLRRLVCSHQKWAPSQQPNSSFPCHGTFVQVDLYGKKKAKVSLSTLNRLSSRKVRSTNWWSIKAWTVYFGRRMANMWWLPVSPQRHWERASRPPPLDLSRWPLILPHMWIQDKILFQHVSSGNWVSAEEKRVCLCASA